MRKPHYWKEAGRTTAPSEIVVFDVETKHGKEAEVAGGELQTFRLACGLAYRIDGGRRTRMQRMRTTNRNDVWPFIMSRLHSDRPVWVWAHNAPFDIGAAGLWQYITNIRYQIEKCVLSSSTTWIKGYWDAKPLIFADTCNYLKMSLADVGVAVGLPKMEMPEYSEDDETWFEYCENDVMVTAKAVDSLIDFVRINDLGRWQPTAASMAFQALRRKFYPPKVLVHCDWRALDIERRGYYGGIVETAFIGRTDIGPIYECDVVSMYPSVCRKPLPTRLLSRVIKPDGKMVSRLMQSRLIIGDVDIQTGSDTYPLREGGKVCHVKGRFRTVLPHPELELAMQRGHVKHFHEVCIYEARPIFKEYMEHFFHYRRNAPGGPKGAFGTFAKLLMNSLYGKTGQRSPRWIEWGDEAFSVLEQVHGLAEGSLSAELGGEPQVDEYEWPILIADNTIMVNCRQYWGKVEIDCGYSESRDSCPAIAATVTSYARCLLREYHRIAGPKNWVYSDTDSIWTTQTGFERLVRAGRIKDGELGSLEAKKPIDWMHIHAPKDYETPQAIKLKGIKKNWKPGKEKPYSQLQFPSALAQLKNPEPNGVFVKYIEKELKRKIDACIVGPDGWTTPLVKG
jgi:DNA polymerase type B, organellar and viral